MCTSARFTKPELSQSIIVVGIDVGGERKGYHAVAIKDGKYYDQEEATSANNLAAWCSKSVKAQVIAIDAPCKWSNEEEKSRLAERELMKCGISCFSTPSQTTAMKRLQLSKLGVASNHYGWMLCGDALYKALEALETPYKLCDDLNTDDLPFCFETYPHAITRSVLGEQAVASNKRKQRLEILGWDREDLAKLRSMDMIDAALCAYTAYHAAMGGDCVTYGDKETGLIIVPSGRLS